MNKNNIYVGNRYVVKFIGAWDDQTDYEPLSAVTDNGNGYVSKRPVPAGTPVTDETYWALWGSGSVVIDNLTGRVTAVESDLAALETTVGQIRTDLTTAQGNITALTGRVSTNETAIARIKQTTDEVENYYGYNVIQSRFIIPSNTSVGSSGSVVIPSEYYERNRLTVQYDMTGSAVTDFNDPNGGIKVTDGNNNFNLACFVSAAFSCQLADTTNVRYACVYFGGVDISTPSIKMRIDPSTTLNIVIPEMYLGVINVGTPMAFVKFVLQGQQGDVIVADGAYLNVSLQKISR